MYLNNINMGEIPLESTAKYLESIQKLSNFINEVIKTAIKK